MSGRLGEEAFETPPMSDVQLGAAYDQREMEAIEAVLAEVEPIEAPAELRERILERIRVIGGTTTGGLL